MWLLLLRLTFAFASISVSEGQLVSPVLLEISIVGNNGSPASSFPLQICQGDCDSNRDCAGSLECFQRNGGEAVPGCSGAEFVSSRTDFCYDPNPNPGPVGQPAPLPVARPSAPSPVAQPKIGGPSVRIVGNNGSPASSFPLQICQGDCDSNRDCAGSLECFQRNGGEAVPGCSGAEFVSSRTDFCYDPNPNPGPVGQPAPLPVARPSAPSPVAQPIIGGPSVRIVGNNGSPASSFPLQICQGDCDSNRDCAGSLECFQRNGGEAVPGCSGAEFVSSRTDFCYDPNPNPGPVGQPAPLPVARPSAPSPVAQPKIGGPSVRIVGNNGSPASSFPLQICQGDCDSNRDCAGSLECFQRNGGEAVPGCSGAEFVSSRTDFCYDPNPTPTPAPEFSIPSPTIATNAPTPTPTAINNIKVVNSQYTISVLNGTDLNMLKADLIEAMDKLAEDIVMETFATTAQTQTIRARNELSYRRLSLRLWLPTIILSINIIDCNMDPIEELICYEIIHGIRIDTSNESTTDAGTLLREVNKAIDDDRLREVIMSQNSQTPIRSITVQNTIAPTTAPMTGTPVTTAPINDLMPTTAPIDDPTPTSAPIDDLMPTTAPIDNLSSVPSSEPSPVASSAPSSIPSLEPSAVPSWSSMPSLEPSTVPSFSSIPSSEPSSVASSVPSSIPSLKPSAIPSWSSMPSLEPSSFPSLSSMPSVAPPPGTNWKIGTSAADNSWYGVTYGNELFVAVSFDGANRVMTSPDGIAWNQPETVPSSLWWSVTFGKEMFVAVGTNSAMYSSNGVDWTSAAGVPSVFWEAVTYGNGLFVAVPFGGGQRVMTSPDGMAWTNHTSAANNIWLGVTYGNNMFVAVSRNGDDRVMTSPDGENWTSRKAAAADQWRSVTYGNGKFVAVSSSGSNRVMTSTDGETWTSPTNTPPSADWWSVTFGGDTFVAVATSRRDRIMTSPDGETWTAQTTPAANRWNSVTFGANKFVAVAQSGVGNRVMTG